LQVVVSLVAAVFIVKLEIENNVDV
jgi:hypothetical protein